MRTQCPLPTPHLGCRTAVCCSGRCFVLGLPFVARPAVVAVAPATNGRPRAVRRRRRPADRPPAGRRYTRPHARCHARSRPRGLLGGADQTALRHRVGLRRRGGHRGRGRDRARRASAPRGAAQRRRGHRADRPRSRPPGRDRRPHRHGAAQRQPADAVRDRRRDRVPVGPGHRRHEGRCRRAAEARRRADRSRRRHHLDLVRPRGGVGGAQRAEPAVPGTSRPARRRLRDPRGADAFRDRGRLQRQHARRGAHARGACALRPGVGRAPTRSTTPRRSSPASPPTPRARSRSTDWSIARVSTPSVSPGASPATSSPTSAWCTSTTASHPRARARKRRRIFASSSRGTSSRWSMSPKAHVPD